MDEISLHGLYQEQNPFEFATSVQFEMSITACNCTRYTDPVHGKYQLMPFIILNPKIGLVAQSRIF